MRAPFLLLFSILPSSILASSSIKTHTLAYEPLEAAATPTPLAILTSTPPASDNTPSDTNVARSQISLQPAYTIKSYTAPKANLKGITPLLRIGLLDGKKLVGSTTLTTLSALRDPDSNILKLFLDTKGEIIGVSWHQDPLVVSPTENDAKGDKSRAAREEDKPFLLVVNPAPEPRPVLYKPVMLNEHGKVPEPEQPKTLLQKYWWVGVALLLMTLAGGGGE